MEDIHHIILKLISSTVDQIHYCVAFNLVEWAGSKINCLKFWEFSYISSYTITFLVPYMELRTCEEFLTRHDNLSFQTIKLMVELYPNINWNFVSRHACLTSEFVAEHSTKLNWFALTHYKSDLNLTLFLNHIASSKDEKDFYKWSSICVKNTNLTTKFVKDHIRHIDWEKLCQNKHINFSNKWWLNHLKYCKYFIFYKSNMSSKFLDECVSHTFNLLIADMTASFQNPRKIGDPFFCNVLRTLYFNSFNSNLFVTQVIHDFLHFAIINKASHNNYWDSEDEMDEMYPFAPLSDKQLKKIAYYHFKRLQKINIKISLELILSLKSNGGHF